MDFTDHTKVLEALKDSQDADRDNRNAAREAHLFIDKRDGQWEPHWWNSSEGRPRYTFDMTGPIVDVVAGEIEQADFGISITPNGAESSSEDAKLIAGIVRNIEDQSGAVDIYNMAARNMVTAGIDGWKVVQKFIDDDSFDQELVIEPIANFIDSVWFGPYKKADASDAKMCIVLEAISKEDYEDRFGGESGAVSVGDGKQSQAYYDRHDMVVIGNIFYVKESQRELIKMQSGKVLDAEESKDILDELVAGGDSIVKTRKRIRRNVYSRIFDGKRWLNEEQKTVFSEIPVIPTIANFKVLENKVIYRGIVEKLLDPQRVFNYTKSREIEEGALAPRAKYWMTPKQASGHEATLATLNTNSDPVQFFNPDQENPGVPQQNGGAQINPGLATLSADMRIVFQQSAGLFAASMGDNPGLQSGVAIKRLQDKGDTGTIKYFKAIERAITRTARILVDAIGKVHCKECELRVVNVDGTVDIKKVNEPVFDQQSGKMITVNDLTKGRYSVSCSAGPSFQSRQQETVAAITEIAAVDPTVIQIGSDILFNNLSSPGMDLIAQRKRQQLFQAGFIPIEQMTDEEKQKLQQMMMQPQQPDPAAALAQAEINKAEAMATKVNVEAQIAQRREDREDFKLMMQQQAQIVDTQNKLADTLQKIKDAIGANAIVGPGNTEAYAKAAETLNESFDRT